MPLNDQDEKYINQVVCSGSFWEFCKYMAPDFYTENREHLRELCNILQQFYEGKFGKRKLAISIPPRMGKTRTLILFSLWVFGLNSNEKIMAINYIETLSTQFSKQVRDSIQTEPSSTLRTVRDIFPNLKIKDGSGAAQLWALHGKHMSYLGGSPTGTLTGLGASITIIDDLIKNAVEALNDTVLENHWNFYTNTLKQRMEEGCKEIVCFTRWATKDLIGMLLMNDPGQWEVFERHAIKPDGSALCPELLSLESIEDKKKNMLVEIFNANYQQEPMDKKGVMYPSFKTYETLPEGHYTIENYTDTADEGEDYLCSITYAKYKEFAYVLDVVFTKAAMEVTEPAVSDMLKRTDCKKAVIESNNGGRGFARAVEKLTPGCQITWFHQSQNKTARIYAASPRVMNNVFFPANWHDQWREFYIALSTYKKEGKNKHDDAPDAVTGVCEQLSVTAPNFGITIN